MIFSIFPSSVLEFEDHPISIPVHLVSRHSRSHHGTIDCWHYKVNTIGQTDDLLGDRDTYTVTKITDRL